MLQKRRYFVSILYFPKGCRSVMFKRRTGEIHKLGACSYGLPLRCISVCLCPSPSLSHTHTHTHTHCLLQPDTLPVSWPTDSFQSPFPVLVPPFGAVCAPLHTCEHKQHAAHQDEAARTASTQQATVWICGGSHMILLHVAMLAWGHEWSILA